MDAFAVMMALTLVSAGFFLVRDYVRFLSGVYTVNAKVISIQQVFLPRHNDAAQATYVSDGFYPVIEYETESGPISFTAIDSLTSGRFHVGDRLRLKVTKSRRRSQRRCRSVTVLFSLLMILAAFLIVSALFATFDLSLLKIIEASFVLGIGSAMLIIYTREQDAQGISQVAGYEANHTQLCLYEPTAFSKWRNAWQDRRQRNKIRGARACAGFCFTSACLLLVAAVQPFLLLSN